MPDESGSKRFKNTVRDPHREMPWSVNMTKTAEQLQIAFQRKELVLEFLTSKFSLSQQSPSKDATVDAGNLLTLGYTMTSSPYHHHLSTLTIWLSSWVPPTNVDLRRG